MSDIQLSDEDRQRLVKSRFGELFQEHADDPVFLDALAKKVVDLMKVQTKPESASPSQPQPRQTVPASNGPGRVSAFEKFLLGR